MVDTVVIPLSPLNNIPGVGGINDVQFDIPQVDDIIDPLLAPIDDVQDAIDDVLDEIPDGQGIVDDINDLLINQTQDLGVELANRALLIDDIADGVVDDLGNISGNIEDIIRDELDDITIDPGDVQLSPDALADELVRELGDDVDIETSVNFESVFGALSSNIAQAFEDQLSDVEDAIDGLDVGDIPGADTVADAVIDAVTALPGGDILADPDTFIDNQLDRVTDGLVDDSAVNNLQDAINNFG